MVVVGWSSVGAREDILKSSPFSEFERSMVAWCLKE